MVRKARICSTTEVISATNSAPSTTASISVRLVTDNPAMMPPSASDPVSPMKILAGAAFHHKKPMQAPAVDGGDQREIQRVAHVVATQARRCRARVLYCQKVIST